MARVQFSAIVNSVRGKVGGSVFQRNRSGYSFKNKSLSVNQQTEKQTNSRSYVAQVQNAWRSLSSTDRNLWQLFANLQPVKNKNNFNVNLNAYQLFLKYNLIRIHCGFTILTTFTMDTITNLDPVCNFQVDGSNMYALLAPDFDEAIYGALIMVSSPKKSAYPVKARFYKYLPIESISENECYITNTYPALFGGLPPAGTYIPYKVTIFDLAQPLIREGFFDITLIDYT